MAWFEHGDYMAEDPTCFFEPEDESTVCEHEDETNRMFKRYAFMKRAAEKKLEAERNAREDEQESSTSRVQAGSARAASSWPGPRLVPTIEPTMLSARIRTAGVTLLVTMVSVIVACLLLEGAVRSLGLFSELRQVIDVLHEEEVEKSAQSPARMQKVLHPFLGWGDLPRPNASRSIRYSPVFPDGKPTKWALKSSCINVLGYRSPIQDYREVRQDDFVIGFFGGSVAAHTVVFGGDRLVQRLEERMPDVGTIKLLNLASGGYKQPQQVITLSLMDMLGVSFDVIVNIDGFNEVVFGKLNASKGYHPLFPSMGHYKIALGTATSMPTEDLIEKSGAIVREKRSARRIARFASNHALVKKLESVKAVLGARILRHERRAAELEAAVQGLVVGQAGLPTATIPDRCLGAQDGCWELIADIWHNGSILMDDMASHAGAQYIHILQPNQYVPGSKQLSEQELEVAYAPQSSFERTVLAGYPVLQHRGEQLKASGVDFHDLTMLFSSHQETIYIDKCCHYTVHGYRKLAERLADLIETTRTTKPIGNPLPIPEPRG